MPNIWLIVKALLNLPPMNKPIILYLFLLLIMVAVGGCKTEKKTAQKDEGYYTCSMHPQVHEDKPGDCPICGMKLIKVEAIKNKVTMDMQASDIVLDEYQQQLANIKVMTVGLGEIQKENTLTGTVVILFIKSPGEKIKQGQTLYTLYSEELQAAQREYLLALSSRNLYQGNENTYTQLTEGIRNKLLLWGMTNAQISLLRKTGTVQPALPIISQQSGTVLNVNIREGEYVEEGSTILRIADLSTLWVEAQEYISDWQQLPEQTPVEVRLASYPNEVIFGKVIFTNPELQPQSTINLVRIQIANPGQRIQPGTQAYVSINSKQPQAIVIPSDAVLRDKQGATVWVEKSKGLFEVRMVKLGTENDEKVEILSGIKVGERVVISGAYALNSEYILKRGNNPMAGMEM
jgi:Cu(I)/Ag(I) efflux system membrane fusion protein